MTSKKDPPGTASECRSCKALIVWCLTEKGKRMPCDVSPKTDGTFFLFKRDDHILAVHHQAASAHLARQRGDKKYSSHFSTCPNAAQHRSER